MACKTDLLASFIRKRCRQAINECMAQLVKDDLLDRATALSKSKDWIIEDIAYRIYDTYSLIELEDIIKWRKRKVLDFDKERD